jgi:serine/threonine-protein kinase
MAPEQARGDRDIDHRADIYALGAILYEACCGTVPATGDTATAILMKILLEEPIPPRQLNPNLSPEIEAVIARAMAKDPNMRFQSCSEMSEALKAATGYSTVASGMQAPAAMPPQAPMPTGYPTEQQPPPEFGTAPQTVQQGPPGYGTAQTPMTWTGGAPTGTEAVVPPPKKKGSAALIAIPVILVLILLLGGAAAAALYFSGVLGPAATKGVDVPKEVASKGPVAGETEDEGKEAKEAKETEESGEDESTTPDEESDGKVKIKFTTTPDGADVILKIGTHQRTICTTDCMHEFNETDKLVTVVLKKDGYRDQELEFTPDFNKELITNLGRKGKKKKHGGTVVKELPTKETKPSWEIKPTKKGDGKKKPIIKVIDKPKKPDKPKKKPAIKIISAPKK